MTKKKKFILILVVIGAISLIGSLIIKQIFFSGGFEQNIRIALVAPFSGPESMAGESMLRGATLFQEEFNQSGGLNGKGIVVHQIDDLDSPSGAEKAAQDVMADNQAVAVVGHWSQPAVESAIGIYESVGIPLLTSTSISSDLVKGHDLLFNNLFGITQQSQFLANYTRNVLGRKIVTIIHDDTPYGVLAKDGFTNTYMRFGTKIRYTHDFSAASPTLDQDLQAIVDVLKEKKDAGMWFIATRGPSAAKIVQMARDAKIKNEIVGLDALATESFIKNLRTISPDPNAVAEYSDKILVSSPLLFDTAGQKTQSFKNRYFKRYGERPDWVASYAYESMQLIMAALAEDNSKTESDDAALSLESSRVAIVDYLKGLNSPKNQFSGVTGLTRFKPGGEGFKPVQIGVFNGQEIISSLTQLQPLSTGSPSNYFEEIKKGRMLYVNDQFMYKTNVVYTGVELKEVSDLDVDSLTAEIEFTLWFRYRGNFLPEQIVFPNAVDPIKLGKPEDSSQDGEISFKVFRVKGKFFLDFLDVKRAYGNYILGLSFRHRDLNRNNLLYVVDVLGMDLNNNSLISRIESDRALNPTFGWEMRDAWISQDIFLTSTFGKPLYVGHNTMDPEFSRVNLGTIIRKNQFYFQDIVPSEYFIYLGFFGLVGMIVTWIVDARTNTRFWLTSTWLLRCFFWPVSILAIGNFILDLSIQNLTNFYTDKLVMAYYMLWWLVPARLVALASHRFIWDPLEASTGRKIPNLIRMFSSSTIYLIAIFGIIAFIFDQKLTSLLATGGLFAMVIGLAIQSNISNIFSGIVVNIERPYSVGDWIKIEDMPDTEVIDITWRTLRLRTWDGHHICMPNGRAAESTTINYSQGNVRIDVVIYLSPTLSPVFVCEKLVEIAAKVEGLDQVDKPAVLYAGTRLNYGFNTGVYEVRFWLKDYTVGLGYRTRLWNQIWEYFYDNGISMLAQRSVEIDELDHRLKDSMLNSRLLKGVGDD